MSTALPVLAVELSWSVLRVILHGGSSTGETSDSDCSLHIPASADVHYSPHSGKPGLRVTTKSTSSWTPISSRTRSKFKWLWGYRLVLAHGYSCILCVSCNVITRIIITVPSEKKTFLSNIIQCKSWLSDNLPRLTKWSTTMSTKMKGEKMFFLGSLRHV